MCPVSSGGPAWGCSDLTLQGHRRCLCLASQPRGVVSSLAQTWRHHVDGAITAWPGHGGRSQGSREELPSGRPSASRRRYREQGNHPCVQTGSSQGLRSAFRYKAMSLLLVYVVPSALLCTRTPVNGPAPAALLCTRTPVDGPAPAALLCTHTPVDGPAPAALLCTRTPVNGPAPAAL